MNIPRRHVFRSLSRVLNLASMLAAPVALLLAEGAQCADADPDWIPLSREPWIEPGSALDFSTVVPRHEPAGKFGRVAAAGDHFEFEGLPGVAQRFYGVNVCAGANLPETADEAERFAANLARVGYNALRLHHREYVIVSPDGKWHPGIDDTVPDPDQMRKFDLLCAACIRHGIYLTTDLYVSRSQVTPWRAIGIDRDGTVPPDDFKLLCAFWEPAYSNLCAWARSFMLHVNPFTGRSLAREPALACLGLVNEGNLGNWGADALRRIPGLEEIWREWLASRHASVAGRDSASAAPSADIPGDVNSHPLAAFLADREALLYNRLRDFVRNELGCQAPLSSIANWYDPPQYALPRRAFDYVDAHYYISHPIFLDGGWTLPSRCSVKNPVGGDNAGVPAAAFRRHLDKPFCVTEFNYAAPGPFRSAGGLLAGTLAALQDWSGIWRFAWSHGRHGIVNPGGRIQYFDAANDPVGLATERAMLCLFLRGDMPPLESASPMPFDENALRDPAAPSPALPPRATAWRTKVGIAPEGWRPAARHGPASDATAPDGADSRRVPLSVTATNGTFTVATPLTCGGFSEGGRVDAGPLSAVTSVGTVPAAQNSSLVTRHSSLRGGNSVAATVWASSLDGKPLAESSRILVTHLTDVRNSGMAFADPEESVLLDWGGLPHLARAGQAEISLAIGPRDFTVFALDTAGRRVREVPHDASPDGSLRFTADIAADPANATLFYEIVAE